MTSAEKNCFAIWADLTQVSVLLTAVPEVMLEKSFSPAPAVRSRQSIYAIWNPSQNIKAGTNKYIQIKQLNTKPTAVHAYTFGNLEVSQVF